MAAQYESQQPKNEKRIVERGLLKFIVFSTAFFFIYLFLQAQFVPPVKPQAAADGAAEPDDVGAPDGDPLDEGDDDDPEADGSSGDDDTSVDENANDEPEVARSDRASWLTLGSMAEDSGYNMLVTLNSRGGGIERIELTKRREDGRFKYRRVDTRSGYLGYFAGEVAAEMDGVLVNVVGPGTPAALATAGDAVGIKPGDVIIAVAGTAIGRPTDIPAALQKTKVGDEVTVEVMRGNAKEPLLFKAQLTEHPLDLIRLAKYGGADQIKANLDRLSCLVTLSTVNRKSIQASKKSIAGLVDPTELVWDSAKSMMEGAEIEIAEFSLSLSAKEMKAIKAQPVQIRRSYSLAPGSYALDMSVEVINQGDEPQKLAYRVEGANGLTMEGWWYSYKISPNFTGSAARDLVYRTEAEGHELISGYGLLKRGRSDAQNADEPIFADDGDPATRTMEYIGVDAQYFNVAYLPKKGSKSIDFFDRATATLITDVENVAKHKEKGVNTSFYLDSVVRTVPPKRALRHEFRLFAGPKEQELMASQNLERTIYYGWFAPIAKLLGGLLHLLYSIVGNYAVAIILLTVIVRGAMFPLSRKAAVNAQRMQELAPEMKKIAEKYKDDMEGRLKAQRELQQRVGFNPLAGCLPMFLQLPIFMGLYRALSVDISLRGEPLSTLTSWASNLAGPDQFYYWGDWLWDYLSGRGTGWMGPYFNILPVAVIALFIFQQKMFMPPATDEQTAMTQKIMMFMTIMMGLFFFKFPAGLCLYFIASSLWGMCERVIVKRSLPKGKHFDPGVVEGKVVEQQEKKRESLAERIRNQVKPPEEPALPPNKRKRPPGEKKRR